MNPQAFIRLSVDSLGLRTASPSPPPTSIRADPKVYSYFCKIRLGGFPKQTAEVPFLSPPCHFPHHVASSFYLEKSDLKALLSQGCLYSHNSFLEVVVYMEKKKLWCHWGVGIGNRQQQKQIGMFRMPVAPEWGDERSATLYSGWSRFENGRGGFELHLRVKLDPDPRYVFQFEDLMTLSPQIVQLQGCIKQPIFSCKFNRDRSLKTDQLAASWSAPAGNPDGETGRRERRGWKVKIHDLSGSAVAAAFITTPFVPSSGCDWVSRSNPGAWLIVHSDAYMGERWQPWGRLEAWRERAGSRDSVWCRFHLLWDGRDVVLSEMRIATERGGEFFIDTERHQRQQQQQQQTCGGSGSSSTPDPSPGSSGDLSAISPEARGFVMKCKGRRPVVQVAMRHVTCVEDAAVFLALAAAVDLSIEACRPFPKASRPGPRGCHPSSFSC